MILYVKDVSRHQHDKLQWLLFLYVCQLKLVLNLNAWAQLRMDFLFLFLRGWVQNVGSSVPTNGELAGSTRFLERAQSVSRDIKLQTAKMTSEFVFFSSNPSLNHIKKWKMCPTIRKKCKYFHSTVQRAKDSRQKFHFCCLPFDVRPRNVKLNLSSDRINSPSSHVIS